VGILKNRSDLKALHEAARITGHVLAELVSACQPGTSTMELENLANRLLSQNRSTAPFKNFDGFRHAICVSLNEEIVNGPPSRERFLKAGDLVSIATAAEQRGIHAKAARTFYLGVTMPEDIQRLLSGTEQAISRVVELSRQEHTLNAILEAIPEIAQKHKLTILQGLGGASIGKRLHEDPFIPNEPGLLDEIILLQPGFAFVLMPMFSLGEEKEFIQHEDGWTYLTRDGALSAHFADTLLMTENGLINLTKF
jgi:methionyl aminopeptidase